MNRPCRITPRASQDIEAIADYLATQSGFAAAETFLIEIDAILRRIAQFPQIGDVPLDAPASPEIGALERQG